MAEYFDAISFKKTKGGKTFAVRLGSASKRDDGGFTVWLDALPVSTAAGCQIVIAPRREKQTEDRQPGEDTPF